MSMEGNYKILNNLVIRKLTPEDINILAFFFSSLSEKTLRNWNHYGLNLHKKAYEVALKICKELDETKKLHLIGVINDIPVAYGFLEFFPEKPFKADNCKLGLVVADKFQGKGIGSKMLKELINQARLRKMRKIWLSTYLDNKIALRLYLKNGFIIEGFFFNDENWMNEKRTIVSMALFLDDREREEVIKNRNYYYMLLIEGNFEQFL